VFADLIDNYAVALFRPNMMLAVLDIVVDNVPDLVALNLTDNKLYSLENLSVLSVKLPNLKVLHIGKNRVSYSFNMTALLLHCIAATYMFACALCCYILR
jgi:hypothetical protein